MLILSKLDLKFNIGNFFGLLGYNFFPWSIIVGIIWVFEKNEEEGEIRYRNYIVKRDLIKVKTYVFVFSVF